MPARYSGIMFMRLSRAARSGAEIIQVRLAPEPVAARRPRSTCRMLRRREARRRGPAFLVVPDQIRMGPEPGRGLECSPKLSLPVAASILGLEVPSIARFSSPLPSRPEYTWLARVLLDRRWFDAGFFPGTSRLASSGAIGGSKTRAR